MGLAADGCVILGDEGTSTAEDHGGVAGIAAEVDGGSSGASFGVFVGGGTGGCGGCCCTAAEYPRGGKVGGARGAAGFSKLDIDWTLKFAGGFARWFEEVSYERRI